MTGSGGPRPAATLEARRRFRRVLFTLLKASASTIALVAIYYLLPLDRPSISVAVWMLVGGLSALVGLIALQVRSIIRATNPVLRAVGSLATTAPLFLLLFAATYFVMGGLSASSFSEPMTRTDALYFTVTVFATVGFGDITAESEVTRALVTGQMVAGIVTVSIGARLLVEAIKQGRHHQSLQEGDDSADVDGPPL